MQYQALFLLTSLVSNVLADPTILSRQTSTCDQQRLTCGAAPNANQSLCASQKSACDACEAAYEAYITSPNSNKSLAASLRAECFAASTVGDGTGVNPIISSLTVAGTTPTSTTTTPVSTTSSAPATTTTAPVGTCDQQRLDCGSAPGANQSLCAVQKNACDACEAAYEAYVTSPGSNKSFAASLRAQCFAASKEGTGDGVVPIISSFSAAQAGGSTATPSTVVVSSYPVTSTTASGSVSVIVTYPASTGTTTFVHPVHTSSVPAATSIPPSTLSTSIISGNVTGVPTPTPTQTVVDGGAGSLKPVGVMGLLLLGVAMVL